MGLLRPSGLGARPGDPVWGPEGLTQGIKGLVQGVSGLVKGGTERSTDKLTDGWTKYLSASLFDKYQMRSMMSVV